MKLNLSSLTKFLTKLSQVTVQLTYLKKEPT